MGGNQLGFSDVDQTTAKKQAKRENVLSAQEAQGVLRSFSRPRVSHDNPSTESLFRTPKCRTVSPS
jgi:transposase InsO family protein